jgi:uncharacterized membrane protein (DUF485 family)
MEKLIQIKIGLNKIDPNIFLDPREVRIIEESGHKLSAEELAFIEASKEYYNSALRNGDPVTLSKDHSLSLEYAKALEEAKDQLEIKQAELEKQKKQLEDDLALEIDGKIKMKKTSFQNTFTASLLVFVFIFGIFPAFSELIGVKLSESVMSFVEKALLQVVPILAMASMYLFNMKNFKNENGSVTIEKFDA